MALPDGSDWAAVADSEAAADAEIDFSAAREAGFVPFAFSVFINGENGEVMRVVDRHVVLVYHFILVCHWGVWIVHCRVF